MNTPASGSGPQPTKHTRLVRAFLRNTRAENQRRNLMGATGLTRPHHEAALRLSEAEIDFLETQVPSLAQGATRSAFWSALTLGQNVLCLQNRELVEIRPDSTRQSLDRLAAGASLPVGTRLRVVNSESNE